MWNSNEFKPSKYFLNEVLTGRADIEMGKKGDAYLVGARVEIGHSGGNVVVGLVDKKGKSLGAITTPDYGGNTVIDGLGVRMGVEFFGVEDEVCVSPEQKARDLLERMEIAGAQDFTAGELVELSNLFER